MSLNPENKVPAPTITATSAPRLQRTRAFAAALMCLYLVGGLLINLHLINHHGAPSHTHHVHHTPCPDAEWPHSHESFDHYSLDTHSASTVKISRTVSAAGQTGILPSSLFNHVEDSLGLIPDSPDIAGHIFDRSCSAPTRAPPADLRTV